jgi:hypothetical protein
MPLIQLDQDFPGPHIQQFIRLMGSVLFLIHPGGTEDDGSRKLPAWQAIGRDFRFLADRDTQRVQLFGVSADPNLFQIGKQK